MELALGRLQLLNMQIIINKKRNDAASKSKGSTFFRGTTFFCSLFQSFLYCVWYFIVSMLGNWNYFFFASHLLDVAICFKTLGTILQSVTHNGKQVMVLQLHVSEFKWYSVLGFGHETMVCSVYLSLYLPNHFYSHPSECKERLIVKECKYSMQLLDICLLNWAVDMTSR